MYEWCFPWLILVVVVRALGTARHALYALAISMVAMLLT
jgi:hypothetical protein